MKQKSSGKRETNVRSSKLVSLNGRVSSMHEPKPTRDSNPRQVSKAHFTFTLRKSFYNKETYHVKDFDKLLKLKNSSILQYDMDQYIDLSDSDELIAPGPDEHVSYFLYFSKTFVIKHEEII